MQNHWVVIGNGSIAKRHLENVRTLWPDSHITSLITHRKLKDTDRKPASANVISDDREFILNQNPYAVIIATPAIEHVSEAIIWGQKNIPLFIEKPLSHSLAEAKKLKRDQSAPLMIGYVLRFFPIIKEIKNIIENQKYGAVTGFKSSVGSYLPDWRPAQDYRACVSAQKSLGGGALLELSHEIDYALWMLGLPSDISAEIKNTGTLEIDVEDHVDIELGYNENLKAQIHLDFLEKPAQRTCQIEFESGHLDANIITGELNITDQSGDIFTTHHKPKTPNHPYLEELLEFADHIENMTIPSINVQDGINVLEIIEQARAS